MHQCINGKAILFPEVNFDPYELNDDFINKYFPKDSL
jgi:hypothetical protein